MWSRLGRLLDALFLPLVLLTVLTLATQLWPSSTTPPPLAHDCPGTDCPRYDCSPTARARAEALERTLIRLDAVEPESCESLHASFGAWTNSLGS